MKVCGNSAIIIATMFCIASCSSKTEQMGTNVIELTVDTLAWHESPSLVIAYEKEDLSEGLLFVSNSSEEPLKWVFTYPDSLYERIGKMTLFVSSPVDTVSYLIKLNMHGIDDKYIDGIQLFGRGTSTSSLKYISQKVFTGIPASRNGMLVYNTNIATNYLVQETDDMELLSSIEGTPGYSIFYNMEYEDGLSKYAGLAAKYPDSQYLMNRIASTYLYYYRSKDDIRKVYDCFSEENKSGYWGSKIADYLATDHFENMELPAWDTRKPEPIITDASKPNLVVFSASWCAPCHAMIPLLKEIHTDLGDRLDIVYVSVDKPETADAWAETMQNEHIPWRSVMALERTAEVHNKYFVGGIPHQILVYPDGTMEKIEIRQKEGKEKLYDAVGK